jgi:hypothetical protein
VPVCIESDDLCAHQVLLDMDDGMRRAFLRFATGSDRVPLLGAHALQLKITVLHAHPERFPATVDHLPFLSILKHLHAQAACGSHVLQPSVSVWIHIQEHAAGQACPGNHRVRRLRSGLTVVSCLFVLLISVVSMSVSYCKTSRREQHECTPINNTYRGTGRYVALVLVVLVVMLRHKANLSILARMWRPYGKVLESGAIKHLSNQINDRHGTAVWRREVECASQAPRADSGTIREDVRMNEWTYVRGKEVSKGTSESKGMQVSVCLLVGGEVEHSLEHIIGKLILHHNKQRISVCVCGACCGRTTSKQTVHVMEK